MQYKIINRTSRKIQIMNNDELRTFLRINNIKDYAISLIKPKEEKLLDTIFISFISIVVVITVSEIIMKLWL